MVAGSSDRIFRCKKFAVDPGRSFDIKASVPFNAF